MGHGSCRHLLTLYPEDQHAFRGSAALPGTCRSVGSRTRRLFRSSSGGSAAPHRGGVPAPLRFGREGRFHTRRDPRGARTVYGFPCRTILRTLQAHSIAGPRRHGLRLPAQRTGGEVRQLPGSTKVRKEIVSVSTDYLDGLSREVRNDPDSGWSWRMVTCSPRKCRACPSLRPLFGAVESI